MDKSIETLPKRQRQVAGLIALGHTNKEIATTLGIKVDTVKRYNVILFVRAGVRNRVQLAVWASRVTGAALPAPESEVRS